MIQFFINGLEIDMSQNYIKYLILSLRYAVLCFQLVACNKGILNSLDDVGLTVETTSNGLLIKNVTREPVYLFIVERNTAALIDWFPGCGESNRLDSGKSKYIAYEDIFGYTEKCEVIVYWWHCDLIFEPGFINNLIVKAY
jgi:hypothetical protein